MVASQSSHECTLESTYKLGVPVCNNTSGEPVKLEYVIYEELRHSFRCNRARAQYQMCIIAELVHDYIDTFTPFHLRYSNEELRSDLCPYPTWDGKTL